MLDHPTASASRFSQSLRLTGVPLVAFVNTVPGGVAYHTSPPGLPRGPVCSGFFFKSAFICSKCPRVNRSVRKLPAAAPRPVFLPPLTCASAITSITRRGPTRLRNFRLRSEFSTAFDIASNTCPEYPSSIPTLFPSHRGAV